MVLTWILYADIDSSSFNTLPTPVSYKVAHGLLPSRRTRVDQPLPFLLHITLARNRLLQLADELGRSDSDLDLELGGTLDVATVSAAIHMTVFAAPACKPA